MLDNGEPIDLLKEASKIQAFYDTQKLELDSLTKVYTNRLHFPSEKKLYKDDGSINIEYFTIFEKSQISNINNNKSESKNFLSNSNENSFYENSQQKQNTFYLNRNVLNYENNSEKQNSKVNSSHRISNISTSPPLTLKNLGNVDGVIEDYEDDNTTKANVNSNYFKYNSMNKYAPIDIKHNWDHCSANTSLKDQQEYFNNEQTHDYNYAINSLNNSHLDLKSNPNLQKYDRTLQSGKDSDHINKVNKSRILRVKNIGKFQKQRPSYLRANNKKSNQLLDRLTLLHDKHKREPYDMLDSNYTCLRDESQVHDNINNKSEQSIIPQTIAEKHYKNKDINESNVILSTKPKKELIGHLEQNEISNIDIANNVEDELKSPLETEKVIHQFHAEKLNIVDNRKIQQKRNSIKYQFKPDDIKENAHVKLSSVIDSSEVKKDDSYYNNYSLNPKYIKKKSTNDKKYLSCDTSQINLGLNKFSTLGDNDCLSPLKDRRMSHQKLPVFKNFHQYSDYYNQYTGGMSDTNPNSYNQKITLPQKSPTKLYSDGLEPLTNVQQQNKLRNSQVYYNQFKSNENIHNISIDTDNNRNNGWVFNSLSPRKQKKLTREKCIYSTSKAYLKSHKDVLLKSELAKRVSRLDKSLLDAYEVTADQNQEITAMDLRTVSPKLDYLTDKKSMRNLDPISEDIVSKIMEDKKNDEVGKKNSAIDEFQAELYNNVSPDLDNQVRQSSKIVKNPLSAGIEKVLKKRKRKQRQDFPSHLSSSNLHKYLPVSLKNGPSLTESERKSEQQNGCYIQPLDPVYEASGRFSFNSQKCKHSKNSEKKIQGKLKILPSEYYVEYEAIQKQKEESSRRISNNKRDELLCVEDNNDSSSARMIQKLVNQNANSQSKVKVRRSVFALDAEIKSDLKKCTVSSPVKKKPSCSELFDYQELPNIISSRQVKDCNILDRTIQSGSTIFDTDSNSGPKNIDDDLSKIQREFIKEDQNKEYGVLNPKFDQIPQFITREKNRIKRDINETRHSMFLEPHNHKEFKKQGTLGKVMDKFEELDLEMKGDMFQSAKKHVSTYIKFNYKNASVKGFLANYFDKLTSSKCTYINYDRANLIETNLDQYDKQFENIDDIPSDKVERYGATLKTINMMAAPVFKYIFVYKNLVWLIWHKRRMRMTILAKFRIKQWESQ